MGQDYRYSTWKKEIEQVHFSSTAAIPIIHKENLFGVLSVYSDKTNFFGREELELLQELAGDIGFGLKAISREQERKKAEEELLKFKLGIERSADAIFMTDPQGVIMYANPAFEEVYGYGQSETIGQTPKILKSGVIQAKQYEQFWTTLLNKRVAAGEIINKTKDGRLISIDGSNNPILDAENNIIGFLGMHRDVSERKEAEQKIIEKTAELGQRVEDLALINKLNTANNRGDDLHKIVALLADELHKIFNCIGTITAFPNSDYLSRIGARTGSQKSLHIEHIEFKSPMASQIEKLIGASLWSIPLKIPLTGNGQFAQVLRSGTSKAINDAKTIKSIMSEYTDNKVLKRLATAVYKTLGIGSMILIPLISEAEIFGLLEIARTETTTEADLLRVQNIAGQLTTAIGRRRAELLLRENEEKFKTLFNSANDAIFILNNTAILECNDTTEKIFRCSREQIVGHSPVDFSPERQPDGSFSNQIAKEKNNAALAGQPQVFEWLHIHHDGTPFYAEVSLNRVLIGGEYILQAIVRDIDERKRSEKKLQESTERLQEAQRIALIGNWDLDLATNSLIWSDEIYRIFEIDSRKFGASYDAFLDAIHPDDREAVNKAYITSLETRNSYEIDHRLLMQDGSVKYVHERCETFYDIEGNPIRSVGTVQDITERQKADQAIRESEARFSTVFQASPIPILILRAADGKFIDVNGAFQNLSGYMRNEVIGVSTTELNQWANPDDLQQLGIQLREQGTVRDFEAKLRTKSGTIQDVLLSAAPIIVSEERFIVILAYDITARKQHEIELQAIAILSASLRSANSRSEMLPVIVDQLMVLLNCETVSIEIIDTLTGDTVLEAAKGIWDSLIGSRQKSGTGINAIISQTRKPFITNDLKNDPSLVYPEWTHIDIQGCIGAPLIAQDILIGYAWMGRRTMVTEAEVRLFTAVTDIAANAIHRTTLHDQSLKDAAEIILAYDSTLEGWAHALELRDQETEGHTRRVMQLTLDLAKAVGVCEQDFEKIRRGALLHDIGKMGIPDSVLLKPGTLNEREWEIMHRHPEYAYQFLERIDYLRPVLDIPYCHHEKWDGSGYPRGLKGAEIPFAARIFSIVDVWDALRSNRPYREAWNEEKTRKYIREQSGIHFDPQVVETFLEMVEK